MRLVVLESAKNRILGVDTMGQPVSPRVWYGMICLLIRVAMGSVLCLNEWEVTWLFAQAYTMQERDVVPCTTLGHLSIAMVPRLPKQSLAYDA
jgi:hypothetical protein